MRTFQSLLLLTLVAGAASAESLKDQLRRAVQPSSSAPASGVSERDASSGVKEALAQGVKSSITKLGTTDGFLKDQAVKVLVPKKLRKLTDTARQLGAGKYVDQFELSMNRAAEQAVPATADIFADAIRALTVRDAIAIVRGEPDAATRYFRRSSGDKLKAAMLPIVAKATAQTGVTQKFKTLSQKSGGLLGSLGGNEAIDLDQYVTDRALDGLFFYVASKEREIRQNPLKAGSDLLARVFRR
jgi:hypothetical protein